MSHTLLVIPFLIPPLTVLITTSPLLIVNSSGPFHFPAVDNLLWNCWNFPTTTDSIGILWPEGKLPRKDHRINYRVYKGEDCQGALSTGPTFFSDYVKLGGWNRSSIPNACVPNSFFASNESWASVEYSVPTVILGQDCD